MNSEYSNKKINLVIEFHGLLQMFSQINLRH